MGRPPPPSAAPTPTGAAGDLPGSKKALPKLKEVSFKRFDTDKNGEISRGEWSGLDAFYRSTYTSSGN